MREKFDRDEQLRALAGVEERAERIKAVACRYNTAEEIREEIDGQLERIRAGEDDDTLKMAVVGEFSAGKSSFINALMREEALESGAAQGTTRLPVIIRYGELNTLYLRDENGKMLTNDLTRNGEPRQEIIRRLNSQSADGEKRQILLYSNSDFFKKGICVVDTPGTNSLEEWHEMTAKRSVSELADGCIILTSASHPMPESLCGFIQNALPFSIQNCIFIVSKIDMLSPEEREKQLEYVKTRIQSRFGAENPLVLPYSSIHIMTGGSEKEASLETEEKIREFLLNNRTVVQRTAQLSKLAKSGNALLSELERVRGGMKLPADSSGSFNETSLSEFTESGLFRCQSEFAVKAVTEKEKFFTVLKNCQESENAKLDKTIECFDELYQIKNVYDGTDRILSDVEKTMDGMFLVFMKKLDEIAEGIAEEFKRCFSERFGGFSSDNEDRKLKLPSGPALKENHNADRKLVGLIQAEIYKTEKKIKHCAPFRILLGAGILAEIYMLLGFFYFATGGRGNSIYLLYFFILAGIGAVVGLISFAATHSRKKIKRMNALKERISIIMYQIRAKYFDAVVSDYAKGISEYTANMQNSLVNFIDGYIDGYRKEAGNIDRAKLTAARNAVFAVENDIKTLQNEINDMERLVAMLKGES